MSPCGSAGVKRTVRYRLTNKSCESDIDDTHNGDSDDRKTQGEGRQAIVVEGTKQII